MIDAKKPADGEVRKRKAHKKSRKGCKNCKLRGVKCDEGKPNCRRCMDYGVACNYDSKTPDLHIVFDGPAPFRSRIEFYHQNSSKPQTQQLQSQATTKLKVAPFIYPAIYTEDDDSSYQLSSDDLDRLGRFQTRTVLFIGTNRSAAIWQGLIVELACSNPYLMHVVQTITAIHDRYISSTPSSPNARLTVTERYHLGQAAILFNKKLSKPIREETRDGLWGAAAMLGAISFATIEASNPEESWPLTPSDPSDLDWIRMSENKSAVWHIAKPYRESSIFHVLANEYDKHWFLPNAFPEIGNEGIPSDFAKVYELHELSTPDNNPYFLPLHSLVALLNTECTRQSMSRFLTFICRLPPQFKVLLEQKDPRALLLLAYWHMKVADTVWFLDWRTKMECKAICIYLERYHWLDRPLHRLLVPPKKWCGYESPSGQYGMLAWGPVGETTPGAWGEVTV